MADAFHHQRVQNQVMDTTFDLVRKHAFGTTSVAGTKRAAEQSPLNVVHVGQPRHMPSAFPSERRPPRLPASRFQASSITSLPLLKGSGEAERLSEYSQRKRLASTPGPSQNPLLSLRHLRYGLPEQLVSNFESLGVRSIYPWQSSCLLGKGLLSGETSLIYTAPTGGGKSLVADVLLLKRIIDDPSKKAILVLPYVALVQEKLKWLRKLVEGVTKTLDEAAEQDAAANPKMRWKCPHSHVRVAGFFGGSRARTTWADIDVAVCTIEKVSVAARRALVVT
jgi:DEAD/DEAH box helicase